MITSNVTTITLDGETTVEFEKGYPYYWITNKGDADIYVSLSPDITPKTDGVYTISAGASERIGAGYDLWKFYIMGSGEAYIRGETIAAQPSFRRGGKGGDIKPIPTDFDMTGITARFDVSGIDINNKIWTNSVTGGENLTFTDGSIVNNSLMIPGNNYGMAQLEAVPGVINLVVKKNIIDDDTAIFGQGGSSGHGNSITLFVLEAAVSRFRFSTYYTPYTDISNIIADSEKWHLFTFVEISDLNELILFVDGMPVNVMPNFYKNKYSGMLYLNANIFEGGSAPNYLTGTPTYFKHMSVGVFPKDEEDWTPKNFIRIQNNMAWLMKNIVDPANEEV